MKNDEFWERWRLLFKDAEIQALEAIYDDIRTRYSEGHRYYHTFEHVKACLNHLDSLKEIPCRREVELALWFHDVIYDPLKKDNEEQSASYANKSLRQLNESDQVIDIVEHLVILTKHPSIPQAIHEKYLIDIDLSILGAEENLYATYEGWIQKEYSKVPTILYRRGRKTVLRSFLDQPRIYSSDLFYEKYETVARINLTRACDL